MSINLMIKYSKLGLKFNRANTTLKYNHSSKIRCYTTIKPKPIAIKSTNSNKFKNSTPLYQKIIIITLGLGGSIYVVDKYAYSSLLTRSLRSIYTFLSIAYAYTYGKSNYPDMDAIHQHCSDQLLHCLMMNRGIYIKLGQAIANQGTVLPIAYQRNFTKLYDDAAIDDWEDVDKTLKNNLGNDYESKYFEFINHESIASASIAQVHKGKLKSNGQLVAIKIQHDYINKQIGVDLFVYRLISKMYEGIFKIPFSFFTRYVSDQLIKETDFIHELNNAENLRNLLTNDKEFDNFNVYIPKNYEDISTKQVLISEWIDGISLTDKQRLIDAKFNLSIIMKQYLKVFGKQIFNYGIVHSDPHPGNLLTRFDSNGKQQLVILDHGLYIELPINFKLEYAKLWKCIFAFDNDGIKKISDDWGIQSSDLFTTIVQLRPMINNNKNDKLDDQRNVNDLLNGFLSDERKFPLELLFLSRTMRMIQNLNQSFGSPVNRVNLLTNEAINGLLQFNLNQSNQTNFNKILNSLGLLRLRIMLTFSQILFYFIRFKQVVLGDKFGGKGEGLEDYIEHYMQNTARSLGFEIDDSLQI